MQLIWIGKEIKAQEAKNKLYICTDFGNIYKLLNLIIYYGKKKEREKGCWKKSPS